MTGEWKNEPDKESMDVYATELGDTQSVTEPGDTQSVTEPGDTQSVTEPGDTQYVTEPDTQHVTESNKDESNKDESNKDEPNKDEPNKDEPGKDESNKDEPAVSYAYPPSRNPNYNPDPNLDQKGPSHKRPRGRAPKGKIWDTETGEWEDAPDEPMVSYA